MMGAEALRIAFFLPTFPEASNTFIINQIAGLIDRGHTVDLFARSIKPFDDAHDAVHRYRLRDRIRHVAVPSNRAERLVSAARWLVTRHGLHPAALDTLNPLVHGYEALGLVGFHTAVSFLQSRHYDVVHCQFGHEGPALARLRRFGAIDAALVTSFRGSDLTKHVPANRKAFDHLFDTGEFFLPVSSAFQRRLIEIGLPEDRVHVLRSGIDVTRFTFAPRSRSTGPTTLLCVGRLTEKKGFAFALEAVALLRSGGHDVDLVIIGGGPLEGALRSRTKTLGISDSVTFMGSRSHREVIEAMYASHILVAPSVTASNGDQEGIPNVLKEAMATGMPVASTLHSGIPELVEHGVSGTLVPERDAEALKDGLEVLIREPERWVAMGEAGRRIVTQAYDMETLNDELVFVYRAAVAAYRARGGSRCPSPSEPTLTR